MTWFVHHLDEINNHKTHLVPSKGRCEVFPLLPLLSSEAHVARPL